ncbi:MAG: ABC transporter substrate-binding protein [Alicyclobacillus macrosporangiidus]|uniref:ABC transporter substrate-binding protein n=1 Tax=Alicyclobacillus macrosporangiidus TaxID=392015 RepID=UPI0026F17C46|nr:ABC transporter substrate-binding protein [Alicyclobacillus macrosporangiidus]MCL6600988.1 ABC transporter substrate-binding protein [Alicyclobacillus macrosporangiidus]
MGWRKWLTGAAMSASLAVLATGCGASGGSGGGGASGGGGSAGNANGNTAAAPASGSTSTPIQVKIMVGGMSKIIYLPAELTEKLGYFKEQGLDVQLLDENAGQSAEEALLAGQVQGAVGFYDHTIDLQSKGKYLESVVQFGATPGEYLMVSDKEKDQIKSLADLKGKKIGITGLGSSTNFLASYLVVKGGHQTSEYTPVPVGAGQTLVAAMQQGKIDAAVTTEPTVTMLKQKHLASVMVDMATTDGVTQSLGGTYPAACLYMQADYVQQHPDVVQKLVNAFVKTMQYIHTHSAAEIADQVPTSYYAGDKQAYIDALQKSLPMFTPDGKMPENGPPTVLNVLTTFNPKLKDAHIDLSKTYTTQFVDQALKG